MYQALYRKYRPKNFDDVVGQEVIVKTLKNAITNNNLTHAYLFTGPRGTGKTSVAKILAKTINCENIQNGMPCDKCVSCTQINDKQSVDIIEIDAASNNGVDEIRELKSKINLVPSSSKYKVYIIDEVHMLTTGAFNALLKTLEEPPSHIVFILATTEPHKIPSTILSRCQRFDFKRISDSALIERLSDVVVKEKLKIDAAAIAEIARISDGGMRDALSILDQVASYADGVITVEDVHMVNGTLTQNQLSTFVQYLTNKDISNIMTYTDEWNESGKNFSKILEELILFYKNLIIKKQAPDYFSSKEFDTSGYEMVESQIDESLALKSIDILSKNLLELRKSNMPKLVFEITILKLLNSENSSISSIITNETNDKVLFKPEEKNNNVLLQKTIKEKKAVDITIYEKLKKLKEIRINNTLATFDKKELLKLKEKTETLRPLLVNIDYSQIISIILDGDLKAAGQQNLIYVFDSEANSDLFNQNILKIEELLEKEFGKKYYVIATDNISWEIIKKEFNSKVKKYEFIEEDDNLEKLLNSLEEANEIENLFKNKIQYN